MNVTCVTGVDPGVVTGIAVAYWDGAKWRFPGAYQCDAGSAKGLLGWLAGANRAPELRLLAAVEEFRPGTGAGARGPNAKVTRDLVQDLVALLGREGASVRVRPAAIVKPWATDKRLDRAGLLKVTAGLPHARDAMRCLLYCGVHDGGVSDPFSKKGKAAVP